MKIRTDFVTNSSSSSFILGFKSDDKKVVKEELIKGFPQKYIDKVDMVLNDIWNVKKIKKDRLVERIKSELFYDAINEVMDNYRKIKGCSYREAYDYTDTIDGKSEIEKKINSIIKKIIKKIDENSFFVEVSYGDDYGYDCDMECTVMPRVKSTIISFNHH